MIQEPFQKALNSIQADIDQISSAIHSGSSRYLVAYSGGMDSHVLLKLCVDLGLAVRAVYIHHGLQTEADRWQQHCRLQCEQLRVEFEAISVDAAPGEGQSPEEAARTARYDALEAVLNPQECLLTAHHKDDQAETLLLQLLRGAGAAGLASMPRTQSFGGGYLCRPLLELTRDEIRNYAQAQQLNWIEDPSNQDMSFDRNFLRQQVFPVLRQRWPQASQSIKQSADIQQENLELIETMAAIDLANITSSSQNALSIGKLLRLTAVRQFNVLRFWIRHSGMGKPTRNIVQQIRSTVLTAAEDAEPLVAWASTEVRRFKDEIYIMPSLKPHDETCEYVWNPEENIRIDFLDMTLSVDRHASSGLADELLDKKLAIRFRQGGEKIRPFGKRHTANLKKLMQQYEVPPWQRSRIPLLYVDDALACVCGYWLADEFVNKNGNGWLPVLQTRDEGRGTRDEG